MRKAFAYVTRGERLLVFDHVAFPEARLQVPAGTIEEGESPAAAAVREVQEETGLGPLSAPRFLGTVDFDARPWGKDEVHERHFFHLRLLETAPERWRHFERHASEGTEPIELELCWLTLPEAAGRLRDLGHGALLPVLEELLAQACHAP